jgi:hypothetical protein
LIERSAKLLREKRALVKRTPTAPAGQANIAGVGDRPRATFFFYIHDRRYKVPTLSIVEADDEACARALAIDLLLETPDHTAIDVCENDRLRFSVTAAGVGQPH